MSLSTFTHVRNPRDHPAAIQTDATITSKDCECDADVRQYAKKLIILLHKKLRRREPKLMKTAFR